MDAKDGRWNPWIHCGRTTKETVRAVDLFVAFASVVWDCKRNDRCLFPEVWHNEQFRWIWRWFSLRAKRGQCGRTWWFCDQWTFRIRLRVGVRRLCCLNLRVFLLTLNTNTPHRIIDKKNAFSFKMFSCSSDLAFVSGSQIFFLCKRWWKIRVRIIHVRALYTGKNGT